MTGKLTRGVIHGRTIELSEDLGLTEGQEVDVRVEFDPALRNISNPRPWGEGLRRSAGAFAADWTEEDDHILGGIERERLTTTPRGCSR